MSKHGMLVTVANDQEGANPRIVTEGFGLPTRDFFFDLALGFIDNHEPVNLVGHDAAVGTSIASIGNNLGELQTYSTTADIDSISSDNIGDTHDITIEGLDINYEPVPAQTVTLNGQNRVAIPIPLLRVQRIYNATATPTLGVIWAYVNTAIVAGKPTDLTKIRKSIHRVDTQSNEVSTSSSYTIPAGKTALIVFGKTTASDAKAIELTFWARPVGGLFTIAHHIDFKNNNYDYLFKVPAKAFEKTDLEVRATVDAGTAEVSVTYDVVLVDNDGGKLWQL